MDGILAAAEDPGLRALILCASARGLRVGSLPSLSIREDRFSARSKGKAIGGEMPAAAIEAMREAELDLRKPFGDQKANTLARRFRRLTERLAASGVIREAYSIHDLRHYFAAEHYRKHRDIYVLKQLLDHTSIAVTEVYIRGLLPYL
jgi:integrase